MLKQRGKRRKRDPIFLVFSASERKEKKESQEIPSKIYRIPSIEVRRARTKVHHIDEGYTWVPKTRDFTENPSEEFRKSKVSGLGSVHEASSGFLYDPRGRKFFLLNLFSIFRLKNGRMFEFLLGVLRLGENMELPQEERVSA